VWADEDEEVAVVAATVADLRLLLPAGAGDMRLLFLFLL
jgi:hypothetical protein